MLKPTVRLRNVHIHHDLLKVGVGLYPAKGSLCYPRHHVPRPVIPEGGYPGPVDERGRPLFPEDFQEWLASLPTRMVLNPFLTHFIRINPQTTETQLKAEIQRIFTPDVLATIDVLLSTRGRFEREDMSRFRRLMNDPERLGNGLILPKGYDEQLVVAEAEERFRSLAGELDGAGRVRELVPGTIDVGPGATDRDTYLSVASTDIDEANPANDSGVLDTFELWFNADATGVKAGTFYGSGVSWTSRDVEVIGNVTSGSKQTFSGLDCDVETDDLAGVYFATGQLELDGSGGTGILYKAGDQFGAGAQTYTEYSGYVISIYGSGAGIVEKTGSDTGSGADAVAAGPDATLTDDDSGSGADASSVPEKDAVGADTGSGADASTAPTAEITDDDTGAGADAAGTPARLDSDSGSGVESVLTRDIAAGDTGSGVEGLGDRDAGAADTGAGVEGILGRDIVSAGGDTGSGAEAATQESILFLHPNASGTVAQHTAGTYDQVDEEVADDDATYNYNNASGHLYDLFNVPNHTTEHGIINKLRVYVRARRYSGSFAFDVYPRIYIGSTGYDGDVLSVTAAWETTYYDWATNPYTGLPWTWDDIDNLQLGYHSNALVAGSVFGLITQVYGAVYFTPVPDPPTNVQATTNLTDKVTLTWTKDPNATGYRVKRDGVDISGLLGDVATYDDTGADPATITPGTATASKKKTGYVRLELSGAGYADGTTHTYTVASHNAHGYGAESEEADGSRHAYGDIAYQLQRSAADSDAAYANISGATRVAYNDTGAPAYPSARYFRCEVSMTDATTQYTAGIRGYRRSTLAQRNVVTLLIKNQDGDTLAAAPLVSGVRTDYSINLLPNCSFAVPADSPAVDYLARPNEVWVYRDGELLDIFPIARKWKSDNAGVTSIGATCMGLGYYLTQDVLPLAGYSCAVGDGKDVTEVLTDLLGYQETERITLGGVSVTLDAVIAIDTTNLAVDERNIWEAAKLVRDAAGGYLYVDYDPDDPTSRRLWLVDALSTDADRQIRLGKNLSAVEHTTDYMEVVNRLYPFGDGVDIEKTYTRIDPLITTDASYAYITIQGLYSCYKGWTGEGDALPANVTVEKPTGSWISGTGHSSATGWTNPENAYDGTAAYANYFTFAYQQFTPWLAITFPSTATTQVKFPLWWEDDHTGARYPSYIEVDIYYSGAWHNVFADAIYNATKGYMYTVSFAAQTITGVRIRYRNQCPDFNWGTDVQVEEIYVWDGTAFSSDNANWEQGEDERTLRCAIGDYVAGVSYALTFDHANYFIDLDDISSRDDIISRQQEFDTDDQDAIMALARTALADYPKLANPSTYMIIRSIDLSGEEGREFEDVELGSTVTIIHEDLGIDEAAEVVRITRPDLSQRDRIQLELGTRAKDIIDLI